MNSISVFHSSVVVVHVKQICYFYNNCHWHAQFPSPKVYCTRYNVKSRQKTASNQICLPRTGGTFMCDAHMSIHYELWNVSNVWRLTHLHCWKVPRSADSQTPLDKTECCKLQSSVWESTDFLIIAEQINQLHNSIYESVQFFVVVFFLSFDKNILWT